MAAPLPDPQVRRIIKAAAGPKANLNRLADLLAPLDERARFELLSSLDLTSWEFSNLVEATRRLQHPSRRAED